MDVFVIGATGFVGGHVARHLVVAGHRVRGLARSEDAAERLVGDAIEPVRGDFEAGRAAVLDAAAGADAVVFAAQMPPDLELQAVAAVLDTLAGGGATFVFTSGSGVLLQRTGGAWSPDSFTEDDDFVVEALAATRFAVEGLVRAAAARDIRSLVIRPGMVWGPGDHGHVSMIYRSVARTGSACHIGDGLNTYANVHVDDVGRLYVAALDRGRAGGLYHAVAGETPTRWIAECVAADLGVGVRGVTAGEAADIWGEFGALILGSSSRIRAPRSRAELGWVPQHTDMLSLVGEPRLRELAAARGVDVAN
jgi:nucleoside-diphosphate-sugar epimerase